MDENLQMEIALTVTLPQAKLMKLLRKADRAGETADVYASKLLYLALQDTTADIVGAMNPPLPWPVVVYDVNGEPIRYINRALSAEEVREVTNTILGDL